MLELAISHGLPKNSAKAKYVIGKSDFKLAELWDMRLGYSLWNLIEDEMTECGYDMLEVGLNFFLMELAEMACETFNASMQEVFARTKKGKRVLSETLNHLGIEPFKTRILLLNMTAYFGIQKNI